MIIRVLSVPGSSFRRGPDRNCATQSFYNMTILQMSTESSTEGFPKFIGKIFTLFDDAYHRDIGSPESLQTAERQNPWHPAA
jgi:hypothetical protein